MDELSPDQQPLKLSPQEVIDLKTKLSVESADGIDEYDMAQVICCDMALAQAHENGYVNPESSPDQFAHLVAMLALPKYQFLKNALALPGDQWPEVVPAHQSPEDFAEFLTKTKPQ